MKFTSKKTVSEVVIDLEDGCVLKLTRSNLNNLTIGFIDEQGSLVHLTRHPAISYCEVAVDMRNGISYNFKTQDKMLIESLRLLLTY